MKFVIEPYVKAGLIRLGSQLEEIEGALGQRATLVDKGGERPVATFPELGVHVDIAADGRCAAIEFMPPATPILDGRPLLGPPFAEVREQLTALDPGLMADPAGVTSERLGVGLYAPRAVYDPKLPPEGAIVFERDYYRE